MRAAPSCPLNEPRQTGANETAHPPVAASGPYPPSLSLAPSARHHLRQEPDAGNPPVRICAGGTAKAVSLPRRNSPDAEPRVPLPVLKRRRTDAITASKPPLKALAGVSSLFQLAFLKHSQWNPPRSSSRYRYISLSMRVMVPVSPGCNLSRSNEDHAQPMACSSGANVTRSPILNGLAFCLSVIGFLLRRHWFGRSDCTGAGSLRKLHFLPPLCVDPILFPEVEQDPMDAARLAARLIESAERPQHP